jgi:hypothetical protein
MVVLSGRFLSWVPGSNYGVGKAKAIAYSSPGGLVHAGKTGHHVRIYTS